MKAIGIVALVVLLAASSGAQAATTALKFGKLWDGRRTIPNAVVIVVDDKIQSVAANGAIPAGAAVIDLTRYTGMPGMIDAHTHMSFFWDPASGTNPLRQPPRPVAQTVTFAAANARRTLEAGVTTVRDLTGFDGADMQMRDAINRGAMVGPRMFVSGVGLRDNVIKNSPAEAGRLAKAVLDGGADWVKIYGSTGRANDLTGEATVSYDEMKSIVDTAHAMGRKVAIHSYGPNAARDAVRAGADTVEHATDMDDATIAEMARKRIWYIPTINHNQHYLERADTYQFSESDRANFRDYIARNVETARKAFRAGVRILPGSDAVFTAFGTNMEELRWLKRIGMSNEQALQSATVLPAEMLGMERSIGAVAPGYFADIAAVEGDPLADIEVAITKVRWVMKAGAVVVDRR